MPLNTGYNQISATDISTAFEADAFRRLHGRAVYLAGVCFSAGQVAGDIFIRICDRSFEQPPLEQSLCEGLLGRNVSWRGALHDRGNSRFSCCLCTHGAIR